LASHLASIDVERSQDYEFPRRKTLYLNQTMKYLAELSPEFMSRNFLDLHWRPFRSSALHGIRIPVIGHDSVEDWARVAEVFP
jgi:hypothetical protein